VSTAICWATDGSENASRALTVAKTLAREQGASLVVVPIVQRYATKEGLAAFADEELVQARLKAVVQELSKEGFDATLKMVNHVGPQPAHAVADVAREVGADLMRCRHAGSRGGGRAGARKRDAATPSRRALSRAGRAGGRALNPRCRGGRVGN
jgi:nucleotide-binding universal stress UspA family protein